VKVLLDECLPRKLMHHISGHEVTTVVLAGWSGKKNGELLRSEVNAGEVRHVGILAPWSRRLLCRRLELVARTVPRGVPNSTRIGGLCIICRERRFLNSPVSSGFSANRARF
jgi:hypothetical protein